MKRLQLTAASVSTLAIAIILSIALYAFNTKPLNKPAGKYTTKTPSAITALPSFTMVDAAGNKVNLQDFKGKKVFFNIWATWCGPCRVEIPSIEKLYKKADKEKVVFVLLSVDRDFQTAISFADKKGMKAPLYYPAENLPVMLYTSGIPATFIFDENGNVIKQNIGAEDYSTASYVNMLNK